MKRAKNKTINKLNANTKASAINHSRKPLFIALILILFATIIGLYIIFSQMDITVFTLGNKDIKRSELEFFLDLSKNQVISKYYGKNEKVDWEKEIAGKTAYQEVFELSLEKMKNAHVIWDLAKENSLCNASDFSSFISRFEKNNTEREKNKNNRELVFGKVKLTLREFLYYELDSFYLNLLDSSLIPVFSEENLRKEYETQKEEFRESPNRAIQYIDFDYYKKNLSSNEISKIKTYMKDIRESLINGEDFPEIMKNYPELEEYFHDVKRSGAEINIDHRVNAVLWETAAKLKINEVSELIELPDQLLLIKNIDVEAGEYSDFSEVKAIIIAKLQNDFLDKLIKEKAASYRNNKATNNIKYEIIKALA